MVVAYAIANTGSITEFLPQADPEKGLTIFPKMGILWVMEDTSIIIEFSTASLIITWVCIKLIVAAYLQRCYALMQRFGEAVSGEIKLRKLAKHFLVSFICYPEISILWACVWPLFALITWRWHPRNLLPGTVLDYLEFRDGN